MWRIREASGTGHRTEKGELSCYLLSVGHAAGVWAPNSKKNLRHRIKMTDFVHRQSCSTAQWLIDLFPAQWFTAPRGSRLGCTNRRPAVLVSPLANVTLLCTRRFVKGPAAAPVRSRLSPPHLLPLQHWLGCPGSSAREVFELHKNFARNLTGTTLNL